MLNEAEHEDVPAVWTHEFLCRKALFFNLSNYQLSRVCVLPDGLVHESHKVPSQSSSLFCQSWITDKDILQHDIRAQGWARADQFRHVAGCWNHRSQGIFASPAIDPDSIPLQNRVATHISPAKVLTEAPKSAILGVAMEEAEMVECAERMA
jgi:hypothetical protein